MKNFLRIATGVDVTPLMVALHGHPELWNQNTLRTTHPLTPHHAVSDIWLWFNEVQEDVTKSIDDLQTVPFPAWGILHQARPIVFDLMRRVEGVQLGRCLITKLPPGKKIDPHVDQGSPATFYTRFHIALQSMPGATFKIEDECVMFNPGDVWKINNRAQHSVTNNSADDRIVMIVDIRLS